MKKTSYIAATLGLIAFALVSTSCVPLAVGAAGGYIMSEEGVEVRSPVTTE